MRAVTDASAWPSHFAMTADGTPRRCSAVPHEWRASCNRIGRKLAFLTKFEPHPRERVRCVRLPDLVNRDVAGIKVGRAEGQPLLRIAGRSGARRGAALHR